jgi:UDP-N-acetylmuramoylalanine--D-glutamate ligase
MLVLGAALSGTAAAKLGRRLGYSVTVYDQRPEAGTGLLEHGIGTVTGRWDPDLLAGVDLVVASPGVPLRAAPITDARETGVQVVSEIEFAARQLRAPMVAVTGTNGKTTVTEATAAMLAASGISTAAVGNIGIPLSSVTDDEYDVIVVEVSSFQLELTEAFHPKVAVLLNLAPDHLDWHPSYAAYAAAKARVFSNQDANDLLIYDADDPGVRPVVASAPSAKHPVSGRSRPAGGSGPAAGALHLPGLSVSIDSLTSPDPALVVDLAAAAVAAIDRGARAEAVADVCRRFRPGSHRRQTVAEAAGVRYVDDSKATNTHAALASIDSFESVVLIAGGLAKGLDLAPLARARNVRFVVAIGEAAPALIEAAGENRSALGATMEEAVAIAARHATGGDTVLLAPGCSSFDMFEDYAARGDAFAAAARRVTQDRSSVGGAA